MKRHAYARVSILVATPGRLLDHLTKTESLLLSLKKTKTKKSGSDGGGLEWLVLDEADRLLDGGGLGGQVEQIIQRLRACCCSDGGKDDTMWRNVLVSATITKELEGMAKKVLGVDDDGWMWARGHTNANLTDSQEGGIMSTTPAMMSNQQQLVKSSSDNHGDVSSTQHAGASDDDNNNSHKLDNAAPRQLAQLYMIVSAKLRLSSLIAFLVARAVKNERTIVFLSTCDSVDYHHALFTSMTSILGDDDEESSEKDRGIFGNACPIYKLHGDIPHNKRLSTLQSFNNTTQLRHQQQQQSAILLATDVAARGLNFPSLDWIVQYDPPCETKDYVHRAGRSARAGQAGHALLFLLPSERQYIEVLELRGLREISPLSLSSTLSLAATLCAGLTREGETKVGGNKNTFASDGVKAFTFAIQNRLEQCVLQDDINYKASIEKKFKGDPKQRGRKQQRNKDALVGPLLEGARKAFSAFVRAYPAKESAIRHIFNARALHLGHITRSLGLKETPKMVSKGNNSHSSSSSSIMNNAGNGGDGEKNVHDKSQSQSGSKSSKGEKRKSRLAFGDTPVELDNNDDVPRCP